MLQTSGKPKAMSWSSQYNNNLLASRTSKAVSWSSQYRDNLQTSHTAKTADWASKHRDVFRQTSRTAKAPKWTYYKNMPCKRLTHKNQNAVLIISVQLNTFTHQRVELIISGQRYVYRYLAQPKRWTAHLSTEIIWCQETSRKVKAPAWSQRNRDVCLQTPRTPKAMNWSSHYRDMSTNISHTKSGELIISLQRYVYEHLTHQKRWTYHLTTEISESKSTGLKIVVQRLVSANISRSDTPD